MRHHRPWGGRLDIGASIMSKIRKSAWGQQCQVRIPGICNFNPETTIHAHLGGAGMGRKHSDIFGARCCSSCHDAADGRVNTEYTYDELALMFLEGVIRTQQQLLDEGLIKC